MRRVQKQSCEAGFTLMELLITMAVLGIVSSVAAMNMSKQVPLYSLNSATKQLVWTLRALRMQAISQNHKVTVTFTDDHTYTVWTDKNDNGQIDIGEVQTKDINPQYRGVRFVSTNNPVFNPTGTVSNSASITLKNSRGSKIISMNASGQIKTN